MNQNYSNAEMNQDVYSAEQASTERGVFVMRVYGHLLGAIALFTLIEVYLFRTGMAETISRALLGVNWLLVLGGFMLAGWLARGLASRAGGLGTQYAGLVLYVLAQAIIFTPMLFIADSYAGGGVIRSAAVVTLAGFVGLTAVVFYTRKDFSFLGALLRWAGVLALVAIGAAVLFGFELGTWFSVAMIGLAGGAILFDTSNILRHWPNDRYVGAALELFASVALMFWYVLRLFMGRR